MQRAIDSPEEAVRSQQSACVLARASDVSLCVLCAIDSPEEAPSSLPVRWPRHLTCPSHLLVTVLHWSLKADIFPKRLISWSLDKLCLK